MKHKQRDEQPAAGHLEPLALWGREPWPLVTFHRQILAHPSLESAREIEDLAGIAMIMPMFDHLSRLIGAIAHQDQINVRQLSTEQPSAGNDVTAR